MTDILLRLFWAILIGLALACLYWTFNRLLLSRTRGKCLGIESLRPGIPAVLDFTAPTCAPCKTIQRPALTRLKEQLGERLQVIEVNASERPDLADYWGVLSLPTTFIIDRRGRPRRVNHGVASAEKLYKQIEELEQGTQLFSVLRGMVERVQER